MINNLIAEIDEFSDQKVELCYHCHKCTAGCPVVDAMSYGPDNLLRMIALDQADEILGSKDIWLCAGCFTCATHCPNDIDIAAIMDVLRQLSIREGYKAGEPDALLFHRLFLGVVQQLGFSHEAAMLGLFKVRSHTPLMNDVAAGIQLFLKGKVPILPEHLNARSDVRKIYERSK